MQADNYILPAQNVFNPSVINISHTALFSFHKCLYLKFHPILSAFTYRDPLQSSDYDFKAPLERLQQDFAAASTGHSVGYVCTLFYRSDAARENALPVFFKVILHDELVVLLTSALSIIIKRH